MVFYSSMGVTPLQLATRVLRGRWFTVFASFLIMSAAGATYIFGIYSPDIKSSLGYNQQTLNTLSFFKDLGANVGILSGLINEVTPPYVVLFLGSLMNLAGYLMIYLAITHRTSATHVWQMCLYIFIGANSQSFANTGSLVTCVKNFPESRGVVLGLLKGFVGLSGAIFTQLYHAFYGDDSKSLVLLIAWLPAAISILFLGTIRILPVVRNRRELGVFYTFLYISLALAAYLMLAIVLDSKLTFHQSEYGASATVILLLLFLPLAIVVKEEILLLKQKDLPIQSIENAAVEPAERPSENRAGSVLNPPKRGEDYTILQALFSADMLILFVATTCGIGGTLTAIDNLGQIGESLGYPARSISTFVSLVSIWNYGGRVFSGFVSEIILVRYKLPRPLMLAVVLLLACVGHLLIAFGPGGSLYIASVIIGFCFGAQWPLLFAIISEIFGLKYYSTLYNFGAVASPVGSYILNVRVAGHLYDVEAEKLKRAGIVVAAKASGKYELTCIGVQCFKKSFLIITAATVFGAMVSLWLAWRTRNFYRSDLYARFRDAGAVGMEAETGVSGVKLAKSGENGTEAVEGRKESNGHS